MYTFEHVGQVLVFVLPMVATCKDSYVPDFFVTVYIVGVLRRMDKEKEFDKLKVWNSS